jgi:hypothetical protein
MISVRVRPKCNCGLQFQISLYQLERKMRKVSMKKCFHVISLGLAMIATANAQQQPVNTLLSFSSSTSANTAITTSQTLPGGVVPTTYQGWTFNGTLPNIAMIPIDDDLSIPIPFGVAEYTMADPSKGFLAFKEGRVDYAVTVPLDKLTRSSNSQRPTLFVSIPGFNSAAVNVPGISRHPVGVDPWQEGDASQSTTASINTNNLSYRLSRLFSTAQYKHFMVAWQNAEAIGPQARVLTDHIKSFLASKTYQWDVVLVGFSRGGVFAHELAHRLQGHAKISKLHVWLLDATAATMLGDFNTNPNPIPNPAGTVYGYMKRDNRALLGINGGTFEINSIGGYTNYGPSNFVADLYPNASSHLYYPSVWMTAPAPHGFGTAFQNFLNVKNNSGGPFTVEGDSGSELVRVGSSTIAGDLTGGCTGNGCTISGTLALGSVGTLAFQNNLSTSGVDLAVSTTVGAGSVVVRREYLVASNTNIFDTQSIRVDRNGINASISNGKDGVTADLTLAGIKLNVNVLGVNVSASTNPLDPLDLIGW